MLDTPPEPTGGVFERFLKSTTFDPFAQLIAAIRAATVWQCGNCNHRQTENTECIWCGECCFERLLDDEQ